MPGVTRGDTTFTFLHTSRLQFHNFRAMIVRFSGRPLT